MTSTSFVEHKKYIKLAPKQYEVWKNVILEYEQYSYPDDLEMVKNKIVDNLEPKFCPPKFRETNKNNPLFGHCYHATQAMYYFFKDADLKAMSAKCQGPAEQHWWLQDGNTIYDVTEDQYYSRSKVPPHSKGKKSVWYGWKQRPQQITLDLMVRVLGDRLESDVTM